MVKLTDIKHPAFDFKRIVGTIRRDFMHAVFKEEVVAQVFANGFKNLGVSVQEGVDSLSVPEKTISLSLYEYSGKEWIDGQLFDKLYDVLTGFASTKVDTGLSFSNFVKEDYLRRIIECNLSQDDLRVLGATLIVPAFVNQPYLFGLSTSPTKIRATVDPHYKKHTAGLTTLLEYVARSCPAR